MHFSALRSVPCKTLNTLQYIMAVSSNTSTVVCGATRVFIMPVVQIWLRRTFCKGRRKRASGIKTLAGKASSKQLTAAFADPGPILHCPLAVCIRPHAHGTPELSCCLTGQVWAQLKAAMVQTRQAARRRRNNWSMCRICETLWTISGVCCLCYLMLQPHLMLDAAHRGHHPQPPKAVPHDLSPLEAMLTTTEALAKARGWPSRAARDARARPRGKGRRPRPRRFPERRGPAVRRAHVDGDVCARDRQVSRLRAVRGRAGRAGAPR